MKSLMLILLFALLVFTGCQQQSATEINITEADNGQTIQLKKGDTLVLTLVGNPTTGFSWEIETVDAAILSVAGEPAYTPDSNAIGAGGQFVWQFEALAAGQTTLKLIYHRSFEPNTTPANTFEITVVVS